MSSRVSSGQIKSRRLFPALGLVAAGTSLWYWAFSAAAPIQTKPATTAALLPAVAAAPAALDASAARHVLDRFAFGPRPGDIEALRQSGFERWWQVQLATAVAPEDPVLSAALAPYRPALAPAAELVERWLDEHPEDGSAESGDLERLIQPHFREQLAQLSLAELVRHVYGARQVEEVMVDFWSNHFNVFAPKGLLRVLTADYVERVLRPLALGRFEDLLVATARHPAMLVYLDNVNNSVQTGANENYARELLELHTLGVDGGYTTADIVGVARILTGWSVERPGRGALGRPFEFRFRPSRHDRGAKRVLSHDFAAGGGEEEGVRLLRLLAVHPATAHHLSQKLCARFVADDPPQSCTAAAQRAWLDSAGDLRAVLSAIAHEPTFWSPAVRGVKLKSPLEFVASALRISEARFDGSCELAKALHRLGEPLFEQSAPLGYSDATSAWANSGGLLQRMDFATALGFDRLPGVHASSAAGLPDLKPADLVHFADQRFLSGAGGAQTSNAIREALEHTPPGLERRELAEALFLGSPEFQRQ